MKILKPSTIIPQALYVERAADRQLRSVINDMGRPAYILVSRQMGKTNLLINMKRQRVEDVVLYLDLSNRFDTAKLWFRNVIDTLIEANYESFGQIEGLVAEQRENLKLEPNMEYDRHLRMILKLTTKRVVIVLDEIDSLVGCSYSDVVLAQVRSMYFSRINYPDYERLTYVLSGVAEPTDLIRDKNISPFNIGEKIYLEDFCRAEFELLLEKSKIYVSDIVVDYIFSWVSGNPRMTWDICSDIEDRISAGTIIDEKVVDDVIYKLYLRDFDRPPVDHIRTLVETDSLIRNAIMSLRWGKTDFPDDKIKGRLYLAGITKSAGGEVKIKNRVIDEALSDRWLDHVSMVQQSALISAAEAYQSKNFELSSKLYEEAFSSPESLAEATKENRLELAICYLYTDRESEALAELNSIKDIYTDPYYEQAVGFYTACAMVQDGDDAGGIKAFTFSASGPDWSFRVKSKINMQVVYAKIDIHQNAKVSLDIGVELLDELSCADSERNEGVTNFLMSTMYNQSWIYFKIGDSEKALKLLSNAVDVATINYLPPLIVAQYEFNSDPAIKRKLMTEFVELVVGSDLEIFNTVEFGFSFNKVTLAAALCALDELNDMELFDRLVKFIALKYYRGKRTCLDVLIDLHGEMTNEIYASENPTSLLLRCAEMYVDNATSAFDRIKLYRELATNSDSKIHRVWVVRYVNELEIGCPADLIQEEDLETFIQVIFYLIRTKLYADIENAFRIWDIFAPAANKRDLNYSMIMSFYRFGYHRELGMLDMASVWARDFIDNVELVGRKFGQFEEWLPAMKAQALALVKSDTSFDPYRKIGRNQKIFVVYGDASPVERKYKQVSADLKSGKCSLFLS